MKDHAIRISNRTYHVEIEVVKGETTTCATMWMDTPVGKNFVIVAEKLTTGWVANGLPQAPTPFALAKEAVAKIDRLEWVVDRAWDAAIAQDRRQQERAEERARIAKSIADREARRADRRARLPMLTVTRSIVESYGRRVGDPEAVLIYGEQGRWGEHDGIIEIDVTIPDWHHTDNRLAEVRCSGFSNGSPARVREYAAALLRAADEAEAFNKRQPEPAPQKPAE